MSRQSVPKGFTLIELMIVTATIAIVAALAAPLYFDYIKTTNMWNVNSHYEKAGRFVVDEMRKDKARVAMGNPSILPADSATWIALLNSNLLADSETRFAFLNPTVTTAPGGGPAYINDDEGNKITGAIGIEVVTREGYRVEVSRPEYEDLTKAKIKVDYQEL